MIYIIYLIILLLLLLIEYFQKKASPIIRIVLPLLFALFIGFRGRNIGTDTSTYYEHFYTYGQLGCSFVERGFDWINRIIYHFKGSANDFFTINSLLTTIFIYLSLNKLKGIYYSIPAFCLYLLTFSFFVNGMRQGIALAIFLYAHQFIIKNKIIPYACLLFLASLFHASSIILIPLYFINRIPFSKKIFILIYIISFSGIFMDFSKILPAIEIGNRNYGEYSDVAMHQSASFLGFAISTVLRLSIFILMLKNNLFEKNKVLSIIAYIGLILPNIGFNMPILGRLTVYFTYFSYLCYPYFLSSNKKYLFRSKSLTIFLITSIHLALWVNELFSPSNKMLPYTFYWEEPALIILK